MEIKISMGKHRTVSCCRQELHNDQLVGAQISGWKYDEKQDIFMVSKYLLHDIFNYKRKP